MKNKHVVYTIFILGLMINLATCNSLSFGEEVKTELEEVLVKAKREERGKSIILNKTEISIRTESLPANVQIITSEDLNRQAVRHYLDFFRKVPGMITGHYGQGDVGDVIGMRGYSSAHGREVAIFVDGVPINFPHPTNYGFNDIGFLTPEIVERIEIIKGPFSAVYGEFALGGVINIFTKELEKKPFLNAELGSYDSKRGVVVISRENWRPKMFLAYEVLDKNGYRKNSEYTRYNLFNKLTSSFLNGDISLILHYIKRDWDAPGYLPLTDVRKGFIKRRDTISPYDGGNSEFVHFILNYKPRKDEKGLYSTFYVNWHEWNRYATFKPSPQTLDEYKRGYSGWKIYYNYLPIPNLNLLLGTDGRYDNLDSKRHYTEKRRVSSTFRNWKIEQINIGLFSQIQYKPVNFFKIAGGVRYDYFDFDITNRVRPKNSGNGHTDIFSPKIGFAIEPVRNLVIYANKGLGFRGPAAGEMSPADRDYRNFRLKPAKVDTWDLGFNCIFLNRILFTSNFYHTEMTREIRVIGGEAVNIGKSERNGYELEANLYLVKDFNFYINYSWVKAKIKNPTVSGQDKITGVPKKYWGMGFDWKKNISNYKTFNS